MQYRWADITGARYFFTANLAERHKRLLVEHIDELRHTMDVNQDRIFPSNQ